MNFRYQTDPDRSLKSLLEQVPDCDLDTIRRVLPDLAADSIDHLALRVEQIRRPRSFAPNK